MRYFEGQAGARRLEWCGLEQCFNVLQFFCSLWLIEKM